MRIIRGLYKGRKPAGTLPAHIRPTTDAVRETVFNIIENYLTLDGAVVLDLFCGAGMFGIEALSRGADKCFFIDKNFHSIEFVKKFILALKITDEKYILQQVDSEKFLKLSATYFPGKYNLIFIDPPYNLLISNKIIETIDEQKLLSEKGIIVTEHSDFEVVIVPDNFEKIAERKQGSTVIDFLIIRK
ncbi:MAG: 16S rRNA (guanine(966)-N(2))-methyltransferase RsmD [FCB group bacterium]|jgi:16S rRNA (guanine(966)-N(2))-methyltransferase RsmD